MTTAITAGPDRAALERAVEDAEIPALLAALAHALDEPAMIPDSLRPPNRRVPLPEPQGGLSEKQQAAARSLAVDGIARLLAGDRVPVNSRRSPEFFRKITTFLTGEIASPGLVELLDHELGLAPEFTLAPDVVDEGRSAFPVAIIGAGMSGIAAGYRLSQAGIPFTIFEKNPEIGGTWFENVYPGCRLDTNNFAYGYSFAQSKEWPHQFSEGATIQRYLRDLCDRWDLRPHIRLGTTVVSAVFEEDSGAWEIVTRSGDGEEERFVARSLISAVGQLNRPNLPDIEGRDDFAGDAMHSARWDADVALDGKRVAVIGTGASAYQVVPAVVDQVAELHVFQRSAPWMLPTVRYYEPLKPGFAWLLRNVPHYERWFRFWQFWTSTEGRFGYVQVDEAWDEPGSISADNKAFREALVAAIRKQYPPGSPLLDKVIPDYPPGAKRMLRDSGAWADALQRESVELHTQGIRRIDESGIVLVDGTRVDVDVIIYCTGFQASNSLDPIRIVGLDGAELRHVWHGDPRAHLGITVPGFPGLYCLYGPNTNLVVNGSATFMTECAVRYAVDCMLYQIENDALYLDCRAEVLDAFVADMDAANARRAWGIPEVSSWYKSRSGRVAQVWPHDLTTYWSITRSIRPDDYHVVRRERRADVG
jgi:4-hydroxyacetophenone monooxygenase